MTMIAMTTLTERSRSQEIALRAFEESGVDAALVGAPTTGVPCSSCIYHYYRRNRQRRVLPAKWRFRCGGRTSTKRAVPEALLRTGVPNRWIHRRRGTQSMFRDHQLCRTKSVADLER